MFGTRSPIYAPSDFGPTGPPHVTVLMLPASTATQLSMSDPQFADLAGAVNSDNPLMMAAEGANVYYSFASQATGGRADPAATVYGPTAVNQCGVIFVNTRLPYPEQAPHGAAGLKWSSGTGATATFRIWRAG